MTEVSVKDEDKCRGNREMEILGIVIALILLIMPVWHLSSKEHNYNSTIDIESMATEPSSKIRELSIKTTKNEELIQDILARLNTMDVKKP